LTKKTRAWRFGPVETEAFEQLKQALLSAPVLAYYDPRRLTRVETDASDEVAAGVLSQLDPDDNHWHPVAFYSKTFNDAEANYEIHDREMLAVIWALEEWNAELLGLTQKFLVITDHRALEYFTTKRLLSARQARWADILSPYDF